MAVVDGNVLAINPGEDPKMQMFIWNNIFFSLGFDVRDHYKELGGDVAAFVAPRNDLHGVRVYSAVDIEGLYTLGTVVVDYRGYRVTAQSIIPGILEREQEQSVVYGSIDFGKTVLSHPKYLELLQSAGTHLKILPHAVLNENDEPVQLCSSVECKGIIGNDGRHYILDLLRTFPPDVNFLKLNIELSPELKAMGFPIEHKHKLCCLRQELLEAFVEDRYVHFLRKSAQQLQEINSNEKCNENNVLDSDKEAVNNRVEGNLEVISDLRKEKIQYDDTNLNKKSEEFVLCEPTLEKGTTTKSCLITSQEKDATSVVQKACAAVGSLKSKEFDFRFNPDVFSPGIRHVDNPEEPHSLAKQKKLVQDAAEFIVTKQIPAFISEHMNHLSPPMDGNSVTETLHSLGINIRYLGKVITMLNKVPRLEYLYRICIMELIVRASKHIYYTYMQQIDAMHLSAAICHFLNCLLSSGPTYVNSHIDEFHKCNTNNSRRKNRNRNSGKNSYKNSHINNDNNEWALINPKSLWQQIKKEAKSYWDFDLGCDSIEVAVNKYSLQRVSILRAFCNKVGIQILLREYNFESRNKTTFNDDDILNVFPIVKHINPRSTDAFNFYTAGQSKMQQGLFKEGYELISEALNLLNNVFGAMHSENGSCLRMLARLSYLLSDAQEALAIQQRAVIMSERINGIDHPCTIMEYVKHSILVFRVTKSFFVVSDVFVTVLLCQWTN